MIRKKLALIMVTAVTINCMGPSLTAFATGTNDMTAVESADNENSEDYVEEKESEEQTSEEEEISDVDITDGQDEISDDSESNEEEIGNDNTENDNLIADTEDKTSETPITEAVEEILVEDVISEAAVSKFTIYDSEFKDAYNEEFKIDNSKIERISNNGGKYGSSTIDKAIDGDLNTHWETGKPNSSNFINEVVFEFTDVEEMNRIIYKGRSGNKGFAQEFEIYGSTTDSDDDFEKITFGSSSVTGNLIEIKFENTEFKRLKFVFTKANQNWAAAGEFMFYKEDIIGDKMESLFTDSSLSEVNPEFDTLESLEELESLAVDHPLYELYKENIDNAKMLLGQANIESSKAQVSIFNYYNSASISEYNNEFKIANSNIESISNNGGKYGSDTLDKAFDGDLNTHWETGKPNDTFFENEVTVDFKTIQTLNRILYKGRNGNKGFAQEFEIYGSKTTKGDTFELISFGTSSVSSNLMEIKFESNEFKRLKFVFKKANQDWASAGEFMFYKEDAVLDKVNDLFTDNTYSKLKDEFNDIETINNLESEALSHPLYADIKGTLDMAKALANNEVDLNGTIITVEQNGNMDQHARNNLLFGFGNNNNQPTGLAAKAGQKVVVYVEADENAPLPKIMFSQQEGSFANWGRTVTLQRGRNEIIVPEVYQDGYYSRPVTKGGTIYIYNPYTNEQQGTAPVVRIEGAEKIPYLDENTDVEELKQFLIEYKARLDEDAAMYPDKTQRQVLDVFEFKSKHIVFTGTASGAYDAYIVKGINTADTITSYNKYANVIFEFYGLDGSAEVHDPKNIRENVRLAQPFGYMYAAGSHIGVQNDVMTSMLIPFEQRGGVWGLSHEIGHRMDFNARLYGETTNNMIAQYISVYYGNTDNRIPYESHIYKNVMQENLKHYDSQGYFEKLGVFWQLEMYQNGYWGELNKLYRERKVQLDADNLSNSKMQYLVEFSSEVLNLDLSEFFARHGFVVNADTREKLSKLYEKPEDKIWYLNNSVINYEGEGFSEESSVSIQLTPDKANSRNILNFNIDKNSSNDVLGYEILRDNEVIGFTATTSFIDTNIEEGRNYTYEVKAYDKKLKAISSENVAGFTPKLSAEQEVTLKLYQEFNPLDYVKAVSHNGEDIKNNVVILSNNVDVNKNGNYEITYSLTDEEITVQKTLKVRVASDYDYASDMQIASGYTGWSTIQKDKNPNKTGITLLRDGITEAYNKGLGVHAKSEVVYNIEGKGYDCFESYIGIDQSMSGSDASAEFEIYVDGEKKFTSEIFKADTNSQFVRIDVAGASEVKLVTTDGGNGNKADHTVWADAKFTKNSIAPELNVSETVYLPLRESFDLMDGVTSSDIEDGDLTSAIIVNDGGFSADKAGTYTITYTVTDSNNNSVTKKRTVVVYSDTEYLSDINWTAASTQYGSINKDKASSSNPIKLTKDGTVHEFAKGIGAHANAEITYNLEGTNYEYFESYVGIDRNIPNQNNSSVIFKVLADGVEVYNSGVMKYSDEAKKIMIPVAGVSELKLIMDDAGNGRTSDHGNFADAKFLITNAVPKLNIPNSVSTKVGQPIDLGEYSAFDCEDGDLTSAVEVSGNINFNKPGKYTLTYRVTDSDNNETVKTRTIAVVDMNDYVYLTDYDWNSTTNSYTKPIKDKSISSNTLRLTNEDGTVATYERGIGAHSTSTIIYDLTDKNYDYFSSFVGVDRQMYGSVGSVSFEVYVDGKLEFNSGVMASRDPKKYVEVDINGAKELKLIVRDGNNGNGSDHATWGDTKLHFAREVEADYSSLQEKFNAASNIEKDLYTEESLNTLETVLSRAEKILLDKISTQDEVNSMIVEIENAINSLEKNVNLNEIVTIKDNELKKAIKKELGLNSDTITIGDMYKLTSLTSNTGLITNIEGLEYAKNLETLNLDYNEIKNLLPLKNLKNLNDVSMIQYIVVGHPTEKDNALVINDNIIGVDGEILNPSQITVGHVTGNTDISTELMENGNISIDKSVLKSGANSISIQYESLNGRFVAKTIYMIMN